MADGRKHSERTWREYDDRCLEPREQSPRIASTVAEPALVRLGLIVVSLAFLGLFLFVPLAAILFEALKHGLGTYLASFQEPDAIAAIQLTFWRRPLPSR